MSRDPWSIILIPPLTWLTSNIINIERNTSNLDVCRIINFPPFFSFFFHNLMLLRSCNFSCRMTSAFIYNHFKTMAGNLANVKIAVNFVFYEINQDLMSSFTSCHYRGSPGPGPYHTSLSNEP